jgi:hypothetical protein
VAWIFYNRSEFSLHAVNVALSRITHTCHIPELTQPLADLADDIKYYGLKHPICSDNSLVFGEKRFPMNCSIRKPFRLGDYHYLI